MTGTAAKRRLLARATGARLDWLEVEALASGLADPQLIEHALIVQLAMLHVVERAQELQDADADLDEEEEEDGELGRVAVGA